MPFLSTKAFFSLKNLIKTIRMGSKTTKRLDFGYSIKYLIYAMPLFGAAFFKLKVDNKKESRHSNHSSHNIFFIILFKLFSV